MQRALPSHTWIRRLGLMQWEGRGRAECMDLGQPGYYSNIVLICKFNHSSS
ncbi:hypothetical protein Taro_048747, partial [Colocasia esculenta]|nr:hypothetical protein [Colocasia esculenta]